MVGVVLDFVFFNIKTFEQYRTHLSLDKKIKPTVHVIGFPELV